MKPWIQPNRVSVKYVAKPLPDWLLRSKCSVKCVVRAYDLALERRSKAGTELSF